jgi:hypothetical protein
MHPGLKSAKAKIEGKSPAARRSWNTKGSTSAAANSRQGL